MFQVVAKHIELTVSLFTYQKWYMGEFEKTMLHGLARLFELIIGLLTSTKND